MKLKPLTLKLALAVALAAPLAVQEANAQTLNAVLEAEIVTLDPHAASAYITRTFGYMVFDTLFAPNTAGEITPQMVDTYSVSDDELTWTFTLRDGLKFHDGTPVTSTDVVASLTRWKPVAIMGKLLEEHDESFEVIDDKTFAIKLEKPFPLMLTALGHANSPQPFIMPARLTEVPIGQPLPEIIGSGPFVYDAAKHIPGDSMLLTKFEDYVPRDEPADFLAGGKVVNIDALNIEVIPDSLTATSALSAGEIDYIQYAPFDLIPVLEGDPNVNVMGFEGVNMYQGYFPVNHANPPFDDPAIRQVLWSFVDQTTVPAAMGLSDQYVNLGCASFFMCDTPLETTAGSLVPDDVSVEAGKAALAATDYDGEEIIIFQATDLEAARVSSAVLYDWMRQVGFNVKLEAMDWASVISSRNDKTAWHLYGIHALGLDLGNPLTHFWIARNCSNFAGWFCDEGLTEGLTEFSQAGTMEAQKTAADHISEAAYESVPAVMWGQFAQPAGVRAELSDLIPSAIPVFWQVTKSE